MKQLHDLAYEMTRCYIADNSITLASYEARLLGLIRSRSLAKLASCRTLFPDALHSQDEYRCLLQIEAFFKKNATYRSKDAEVKAYRVFQEMELRCAYTNWRLHHYMYHAEELSPQRVMQIRMMRSYIKTTLGDFESFLESLPRMLRLTAGATATRPRKHSQPYRKVSKEVPATWGTTKYIDVLADFFGINELKLVKCDHNRVGFVPKKPDCDRTMACEADGSLPFQLAFDRYGKIRLNRRGIDLRRQSLNRSYAYQGSLDDSLSTIDLEGASDCVAYNTVKVLFPKDWFAYLCDIRSEGYDVTFTDGSTESGTYHKFSSMGNGATFVLETLIFAAACKAVGSKEMSVYGDDIIIESALVGQLTALLSFLGFSINADKSHVKGPFRESCGGNYYKGVDITPFYVREIDSRKTTLSHIVNGLVSISHPGSTHMYRLCCELVRDYKLNVVPFNESTVSGVFVDPVTAHDAKLISYSGRPLPSKPAGKQLAKEVKLKGKTPGLQGGWKHSPWIPMFKAYVPAN